MQIIQASQAPAAIGPYVPAVRTGQLLYCSGQTPIDPATGKLVPAGIAGQTTQALRNLEAVLHAAGLSLRQVVKTNVYLHEMADFKEMNAAYEATFDGHRPARTTVAVKGLPYDALVEIACIAEFDQPENL